MTSMILGYLSPRGLGNMTHDMRVNLGIEYQMVPVDKGWGYVPAWMDKNNIYLEQWEVQREDLEVSRDVLGVNTLISIETPYGSRTFQWAQELGMRTILVVMWEAFNPRMPDYRNVDLYVCPSFKAYQEVPFDNKIFLPYPIDVDEFEFKVRSGPAKTFVHNVGTGGMNLRKGTVETLKGFARAWERNQTLKLILHSQIDLHHLVLDSIGRPEDQLHPVDSIEFRGPVADRKELYQSGDVLIYPSHYDGHSLVGLEGMASGMPVITTDAAPMNEYWKHGERELLVDVGEVRKPEGLVNPHCYSNVPSSLDIANKILWCAENDMETISRRNRATVEKEYAWENERSRWLKAFHESR